MVMTGDCHSTRDNSVKFWQMVNNHCVKNTLDKVTCALLRDTLKCLSGTVSHHTRSQCQAIAGPSSCFAPLLVWLSNSLSLKHTHLGSGNSWRTHVSEPKRSICGSVEQQWTNKFAMHIAHSGALLATTFVHCQSSAWWANRLSRQSPSNNTKSRELAVSATFRTERPISVKSVLSHYLTTIE